VTVAALLAFLAAGLGAAGAGLLLPARMPAGLIRRPGGSATRVRPGARLVRLLARIGALVRPAGRAQAPRDLDARIAAAGRPAGLGPREVMAAKLAGAVAAGLLAAVAGAVLPGRLGVAAVLAGPVAGFLTPDLWLRRRAQERARRVRADLPGMLDLLRVSVEAGLPLASALGAVGERAHGPLAVEWRRVGREVSLGVPSREALGRMVGRLPLPEVSALVGALDRAARHGAPLAETLGAQAREARHARRRRIQEEAAKAGPKIQLVVALLLVPSVLLLVAAALAAALLGGGATVAVG